MISPQNEKLMRDLWPNCRYASIPDNYIGTCYAYELADLLEKAREEGRREIIDATHHARVGGLVTP